VTNRKESVEKALGDPQLLVAVDANHALFDVEVAEADVERFGDSRARTDQERRERPVLRRARVEVVE
jgi:hypothetical protein